MNYPETYYTDTALTKACRSKLNEAIKIDVCIIGAGIAGLTAALELLRNGKSVAILETHQVAWGASGRNGGLISPGWSQSISAIEKQFGLAYAQSLYALSVEGIDIVRNNIEQLNLPNCMLAMGQLRAARYPQEEDLKARQQTMLKKYNYKLEYVSIDEMRDFCDSKRYYEGLFDPNAFHFHPMNYCIGIANEIERLGGIIFENTAMISTDRKKGERKVYTANGEVICQDVIFCGGGYSGPEAKKLYRSFLPISTYMVVTEPLGDLANKLIKRNYSFCDDRRAADYYRLVDGDRLLWGSRITTKDEPEVVRLTKMLKKDMCSVYPQLADVKIDKAWSGLMAYASHKMPIIGPQADDIWFCSSFGGHGMNTGTIGGHVVAEGICGKSERYRLFEPFGLKWNGGVLGPIAANIVYKSLSVMDYIQEYNH